jgi:hypothetical protein
MGMVLQALENGVYPPYSGDVMKRLFAVFFAFLLTGCMEREIFTEIADPSRIGHPPATVVLIDPRGDVNSALKIDEESPTKIEVYIHRAACSSPSAKALGSDFDGYVRITIFEESKTIARAQMDYKGEPTADMTQHLYDTLIKKLQWSNP